MQRCRSAAICRSPFNDGRHIVSQYGGFLRAGIIEPSPWQALRYAAATALCTETARYGRAAVAAVGGHAAESRHSAAVLVRASADICDRSRQAPVDLAHLNRACRGRHRNSGGTATRTPLCQSQLIEPNLQRRWKGSGSRSHDRSAAIGDDDDYRRRDRVRKYRSKSGKNNSKTIVRLQGFPLSRLQ